MAQKEATVYILDLGRSMGEKRHGRGKSNFDWSMEYIWDKITTTVSSIATVLSLQLRCLGFDGAQDSIDRCAWVSDRW